MWAPPEEELLVDSCFNKCDGDVVGYEKIDKPVRLDAGDVDTDPLSRPYRDSTLTLSSVVVCVGCRSRIVARV
jgi:hypothetical protein